MQKRMTPRRLTAFLAVFAFAVLAVTASPASAGTSHDHATISCGSWDTSQEFNSLNALSPMSTAKGDLNRERNTSGIAPNDDKSSGKSPPPADFAATIPVYFHVVHDGATGLLTQADVEDQIEVLNLNFGGFPDGADTGFSFELEAVTFTNNAEWFAQETFAAEIAMKAALKQGDATALNLYSTSGGGFLGWAYYPTIVHAKKFTVLDGVVIHYGSLPGGPIANFNEGKTATHEVGHYLGLAHTFEKGCIGAGDQVDDTPAMSVPTSGCPEGKDTCPEPGLDPIHNYMDYSWDSCYTEFTEGQATRMQQQYLHWRLKHGYS